MEDQLLIDLLKKLDIDKESSTIFVELSRNTYRTPLQLARATKIDRAKVYRRLESLLELGLVVEVIEKSSKAYKISDPKNIEFLYQKKKNEIEFVSENIDQVINKLNSKSVSEFEHPGTKVLFYKGMEGIKQQVWNTLRAKKEVLGYTHRSSYELMGDAFYIDWATEFNKRKLKVRDIISQDYIDRYQKFPELRKELIEIDDETRLINNDRLMVRVQMDLYDGVVSYYSWTNGDIFGVEIYNNDIFEMQKELFEIAWINSAEI